MLNIFKDRRFASGFMAGTMLCAVALIPIVWLGHDATENLYAAAQATRASLDSCTGKFADLNSHWTLITEKSAAAVPAAQLLNGLVAISPGQAIVGTPAPVSRWAIPVKIRPYVFGPMDGARFYYWDPETRELDGPHIPAQGDAQRAAQ